MLDDVLAAQHSAWNEPDPAVRAQLLARSLAEDAELVDPTSGRFNGRDAINERIAGFSARFRGAQLTLTSGVDEHKGFARYAWANRCPTRSNRRPLGDASAQGPDRAVRHAVYA